MIENFVAIELPGNDYRFEGDVLGEGVLGQEVRLGGLPTLEGPPRQITYVALGDFGTYNFTLTVTLAEGEFGIATAETQDDQGRLSNVAETVV